MIFEIVIGGRINHKDIYRHSSWCTCKAHLKIQRSWPTTL